MADYRLSAKVISRARGQSAVASSAYRSAAQMRDERTGQVHDFTRKGGLVHEEIMAPDNAPGWMRDREQLWNAVEAVERRKDAQLAREMQLSLPHELDAEQRRELTRAFVREQFVDRGMIADMAIHEPGRNGDQRNHHAHVMLTMRELTGDGFGKKNRDWNAPELLKAYRLEWANHQNREFERLGLDVRVDHRSYEERGIDREPTQHLGPSAHEMEVRGRESRIGDENREREARNSERSAKHNEAANLKLAIEKQQERFQIWAEAKRTELQSAHELSALDLERRHDRQKSALKTELEQTFGEHKATLQAEMAAIDRRLDARGVRKFFRNTFGRTRADQTSRKELTLTLDSIAQRETERHSALALRQEAAWSKEQERQQANQARLDQGIERARERRESQGWKPLAQDKREEPAQRQVEVPQNAASRPANERVQEVFSEARQPKVEKSSEQQNERTSSQDANNKPRRTHGRGHEGRGSGRGSGLER